MEGPSPIALLIQTEVNINQHLFEFRTLRNFTDFTEKLQILKINPEVVYEFIDNIGEKKILSQENYQEFLCSSDGYKNYLFGKLDSDKVLIITDPPNRGILENWRCPICQNSSKPSINICYICKFCRVCRIRRILKNKNLELKCESCVLCEICNVCSKCKCEKK